MPVHVLYLKCDLENVREVRFDPAHRWCLDIKNPLGEDVRKEVWVSAAEEHDLDGSRGTANFVMKWDKASKKQCYACVQQVKNVTRPITEDDSGSWVPVVAFECRGLDPIAFHPTNGATIVASSGAAYEDCDISDDWCEVDEKTGECSTVMNIEAKFELHR
ncbi:unnamed protein product [Pedinophyceae sp. YPF-701]|nr:unnamed protein product [Pedinophyceae sp. YPF-701]